MRIFESTLSILILFTSISAFAQTKNAAVVRTIEASARSVDKLFAGQKEPDVVVADVSDYDSDKAEWRTFKSKTNLDTFRDKTETYSVAYIWRARGKIALVAFTMFSPSGDWAEYVTYYFRHDGSAAKVTSELRTFYGDYLIIRERYFDPRGRLLKQTSKFLDLVTKKPKKPTKDVRDAIAGVTRSQYYKKVSALPFYSLLSSS